MSHRKFKFKIIKRDPKQIGFDFQQQIETDKEKVLVKKDTTKIKGAEKKPIEQIRKPRRQRNFDYLNTPSFHNYYVSIQEDIDMEDTEFIKYIVNRVSPEFREEILKSVMYEYNKRKREDFLEKYKLEIEDRISFIYDEIEKYQEITLDDIRELLLLFSKSKILYIADSIEELEEDFSETLDIEKDYENE